MKIQIDTTEKIIKIEEKVSLKDLMSELKTLLPKTWEEYFIEGGYYWYYYPSFPTINPPFIVTCGTSDTTTYKNDTPFTYTSR